jgi:hypothetical protein
VGVLFRPGASGMDVAVGEVDAGLHAESRRSRATAMWGGIPWRFIGHLRGRDSNELPNGLELSRSAEAGGATPTLAPASDQDKSHADSAEQPGRHLDSPNRRAAGDNLSARPPSRLQRVVGRRCLGQQPRLQGETAFP